MKEEKKKAIWVLENNARYTGEKPMYWTGSLETFNNDESESKFWTSNIHEAFKAETKQEIQDFIESYGISGEPQEHQIG